MHCSVTLARQGSEVVACCSEFPACEGRGPTGPEALARLRAAVVFWMENCPCDVTAEAGLVMQVVEDTSAS